MTFCDCNCDACIAPNPVRDSVGEVLGYPKCCRDAFKRPIQKNRKTKALLQKRKLLRKMQKRAGFNSITQYYPCLSCAAQLYRKCKRAMKQPKPKCDPVVLVFEEHLERPWPLDIDIEVNFFNEKFNDHAWEILSECRYARMTNELWGEVVSSKDSPKDDTTVLPATS